MGYSFLSEEICRGFVMRETQKAKHLIFCFHVPKFQKPFSHLTSTIGMMYFISTIHFGPAKLNEFMMY